MVVGARVVAAARVGVGVEVRVAAEAGPRVAAGARAQRVSRASRHTSRHTSLLALGSFKPAALAALQKPKPAQGSFKWMERPPGRRGQRQVAPLSCSQSCTSDPAGPVTRDAVRSFRKPSSRLRLPDGAGWVPHGTGAAAPGAEGGCRASV